MALQHIEERLSDDEIFIGELTLKEVKKRVFPENYRQTIGCVSTGEHDDHNASLKIIESHSAPDIAPKAEVLSPRIVKSTSNPGLSPEVVVSDWDIKPDDSFLKIEKMVSELCVSPKNDVNKVYERKVTGAQNYFFKEQSENDLSCELKDLEDALNLVESIENNNVCVDKKETACVEHDQDLEFKTPLKNNYTNPKLTCTPCTPRGDIFATPSNESRNKTSTFKTPGIPVSHKKLSVTPRKFQHVVSPVATYIKKCPMVPLVKDVCPKKPLPGHSSIPKLIKHTPCSKNDKENVKLEHCKPEVVKQGSMKLPSVAYRNAKETQVINIPDEGKLPQSQWAKQVASSIPRAFVIKHNSREVKSATKAFQHKPEDSFADLSLQQADLSVCTKKSAFNKSRKIL